MKTFGGLFALAVLITVSCSSRPELRLSAASDTDFGMIIQDPVAHIGASVVWAGEIIKVSHGPGGTEITVLQIPLAGWGLFRESKYSQGRFIARSPVKLDKSLFTIGQKLVVLGKIEGSQPKPIGDNGTLTYAMVAVEELHFLEYDTYGKSRNCWRSMGWDGPYRWRCHNE